MKVLNSDLDVSLFWENLKKSKNRVLLLDYDGTLAPFRVERDEAVPYPGVKDLLEEIISSSKSRLVIISGRQIDDLLPLLNLTKTPEMWGAHGRERILSDGRFQRIPVSRDAEDLLKDISGWMNDHHLSDLVENKPGCLAVHFRGLEENEAEKIKREINDSWGERVAPSELDIHAFDGGIEFREASCHKGLAVDTILKEAGEGAVTAYLGDDLTDEDAFRAIKGRGIGCLVREQLRDTLADIWLRPPQELFEFLQKWITMTRT